MGLIQQLLFAILLGVTGYFAYKQYSELVRKIRFGKDREVKGTSQKRLKNLILIAFGQKKMFKRWIPAVFHLFIYVAFLFTQIELIEIIVDGIFGVHRFFAPYLGIFYTILISSIEILSLLALVATFIFLWRRNLLKVPRLVKPEMKGWPTLDANLILIGELLLVMGIFTMNGADSVLQSLGHTEYPDTGTLAISSWFGPAVFGSFSESSLIILERGGWWLHLIVVLAFINYLPKSKHLHILLAFPNVYFSDDESRGEMNNMPDIMNEVKSMMGLIPEDQMPEMSEEIPEFGAKDVFDLSWKNILESYTCTECGRCTSVCPANTTGKKLSPRKIMMDIRDRTDEIAPKYVKGEAFDDGKSLFDYISKEEIFACTTCNACVEACPVMINPLEPILDLRRYVLLTESAGPNDWLPMFNAVENNGAVWQMPDERIAWKTQLEES